LARRVSLPAADDLFRPTTTRDESSPSSDASSGESVNGSGPAPESAAPESAASRKPSGRVRHDEKMTVYVTADELMELEHTRLTLRRAHGLAIDRGRVVREAVAIALADFELNGEDSVLVQRLRES
jgi:hypothetical protein